MERERNDEEKDDDNYHTSTAWNPPPNIAPPTVIIQTGPRTRIITRDPSAGPGRAWLRTVQVPGQNGQAAHGEKKKRMHARAFSLHLGSLSRIKAPCSLARR
jgi:hypothetical protein